MLNYFLTLLFCCFFLQNYCQNPQPALRHYSTDDGLPSSEVYDILEDTKGYIWISTDNGVSRFDGYGFENYGPAEGLMNNVVLFMQEDDNHRIWFTTMSSNIYYFENDSIYPYQFNDIIQKLKGRVWTDTKNLL